MRRPGRQQERLAATAQVLHAALVHPEEDQPQQAPRAAARLRPVRRIDARVDPSRRTPSAPRGRRAPGPVAGAGARHRTSSWVMAPSCAPRSEAPAPSTTCASPVSLPAALAPPPWVPPTCSGRRIHSPLRRSPHVFLRPPPPIPDEPHSTAGPTPARTARPPYRPAQPLRAGRTRAGGQAYGRPSAYGQAVRDYAHWAKRVGAALIDSIITLLAYIPSHRARPRLRRRGDDHGEGTATIADNDIGARRSCLLLGGMPYLAFRSGTTSSGKAAPATRSARACSASSSSWSRTAADRAGKAFLRQLSRARQLLLIGYLWRCGTARADPRRQDHDHDRDQPAAQGPDRRRAAPASRRTPRGKQPGICQTAAV